MATKEALFACTHCHKRCKFEELSSNQQLCKSCRKRFPLVTCTYCRLEFHPVKNSGSRDSRPACEHCARDFKQHGTPSFCVTCNLQSAFSGKMCTRCVHSEKKYGPPVACEDCQLVCAFRKPDEARKKVDGKTLCLLCTINYKKAQFLKKTHEQKSSSSKHKDRDKEDESSAKRMKMETGSEASTSSSQSQSLYLLARDSQPMDILGSNHVLETDKLQNEISSLKKQLAQRDQALLEKDKQICTLKAEVLEKEKEFRQKLQSQQRTHQELVEVLQVEVRNLKKQISQSSHRASLKNPVQTASPLTSLSSSLTPS